MPGYRGHLFGAVPIIGTFYLVGIGAFYSWQMLAYMSLLAFLGALAPDIDTKSRGRLLFFVLLAGAMLYAFFVGAWLVLIATFILALLVLQLVHRQRLHRFSFWLVIVSLSALVTTIFIPTWKSFSVLGAASFLLGVASHLVLDRCRFF